MATEKRMIDVNTAREYVDTMFPGDPVLQWLGRTMLDKLPKVDAVEAGYTAHEVAEIIAELFGDSCACNFNGIDEWLPFKCELLDCCPNTYGVACWEQYLKFRDGERQ